MKIAINGFGRIGKNFLRAYLNDVYAREKIQIVAINVGPATTEFLAPLFKYDTLMGTYPGHVTYKNGTLNIDDVSYPILQTADPVWFDFNVDWVVDCSGAYTQRERAEQHIKNGAEKVLISAPAHNEDITIIPGVNAKQFDSDTHAIVSLGSCTTNALAPMMKVLQQQCGFQQGFMSTVHAYTNSQCLLDGYNKDPRRARAAALNIVPTTTGATKVIDKIFPDLMGNLGGMAYRVPVGKVSMVDICFVSSKELSYFDINAAFENAAKDTMRGIVDVTMEPLVSSDIAGNSHSVIIDGSLTQASGTMGKVFGWYDNEWGYSMRLKDFLMEQY